MHELQQLDYLPYRRTAHGVTILYRLISIELAQYEIYPAEVAFSVL